MLERLKMLFKTQRENPAANEAERLMAEHGELAVYEARSALHAAAGDRERTRFASRVVEEVRRQTGQRVRADTATRMAMRED